MSNTVMLTIEYRPDYNHFVVTIPNPDEEGGMPPFMGLVDDELKLASMVHDAARELFELALAIRDLHLEEAP